MPKTCDTCGRAYQGYGTTCPKCRANKGDFTPDTSSNVWQHSRGIKALKAAIRVGKIRAMAERQRVEQDSLMDKPASGKPGPDRDDKANGLMIHEHQQEVETTNGGHTHGRHSITRDVQGKVSVVPLAAQDTSRAERRTSISPQAMEAAAASRAAKPAAAGKQGAAAELGDVSSMGPGEAFSVFLDARSVADIEQSFRRLVELSRAAGMAQAEDERPYVAMKSLQGMPWKAAKIWGLMDAQVSKKDYSTRPFKGKHVVVVGAGPVGLRFAAEASLAGGRVTVVEKRGEFVRINRLHLWDWVKQDLVGWGAKIFSPPGGSFGADKDYIHIGISELQHLMLKCCLLLGVAVELGVEFQNVSHAGDGWLLETNPKLTDGRGQLSVDGLICADGAASRIAVSEGSNMKKTGLGKEGKAIGIVANFQNSGTKEEREVRQFSWARQFNRPLFQRVKAKLGADLENIVYYRGDENHYMIMTPSKQCLLDTGCLKSAEPQGKPLLDPSNVDLEVLKGLSRNVAQHFGLPETFTPTQSCMAFDFSDTRRHERSVIFKKGAGATPLPLCLIGDALLEPFWPTGLGCIRGFLGALDAMSNLIIWFATRDAKAVEVNADMAFKILKSVEGQTKDMTLRPDHEWQVDPSTRYKGFSAPALPTVIATA